MMKPVKRVFLILGAMSMFSLFQFDAMAKACNKKDVEAGKWCRAGGAEYNCRSGCYCEGANKKDGIPVGYNVDNRCGNRRDVDDTMTTAGVKLCPLDFPNSAAGAKSETDCYTSKQTYNGEGIHYGADKVTFKVNNTDVSWEEEYSEAGARVTLPRVHSGYTFNTWSCEGIGYKSPDDFFLRPATHVTCTGIGSNKYWLVFYCNGNPNTISNIPYNTQVQTQGCGNLENFFWKCTNNVGVVNVMDKFIMPAANVECYSSYCDAGKYFENNTCTNCPRGYYCPGDNKKHLCEGNTVASNLGQSSCRLCEGTRVASADHTGCINSTGGGGGNTGGNGTTCATGQYLVYGTAEPADITQRVDINPDDIEEVSPVSKRTNPNNNKAFAETNANNNKASGETKANLSRSVVSRAAKLTGFETSLSDVGQIAPKSLPVGVGGTCKDCEAGYYCPDKQHRYRCGDGTYTSTTGQTSCQPCNGTVTHPANNSSLNTGCTPNPGDHYSVTYKCGEGSGTPPTDSNSYSAGVLGTFAFTLRDKGYCTAPSSKPGFDGWNCGNNISGQAGESITVPAADVICTAQWKSLPPDTYNITYHNVDGVTWGSQNHPTTYTYGTSVTIGEPSRANYDFQGWCKVTDNCQQPADSYVIAATDTGNLNLYAQWTCANGYVWGNGNICIPANNCDGEDQFVADEFCFTCPANSSVNETGDGCVNDSGQDVPPISPTGSVTCGLGEYVDDDGVCQTCPTGRFCPGNGNYYKCPFGSPTSNKASCSFSLNESKLYHGQSTSGNCWKHLNNASNYRDCMYGFHLESLRGN